MKNLITILTLGFMTLSSGLYGQAEKESTVDHPKTTKACSSSCKAKNKSSEVSCKLTTAELQERRETVLKSLKSKVVQKKELENGYAFQFPGTDDTLDELTEFIKTERACCDFFVFGLSISGDQSEAWLEMTGPEGAKAFIATELGL